MAEVKPNEPFHIFVLNFETTLRFLFLEQRIPRVSHHTKTLIESHMSNAELLDIIVSIGKDNQRNVYWKQDSDSKEVEFIKTHLADEREKHVGADRKTVTTYDIKLDVYEEYVPENRQMLKKHESMCIEDLGDIKFTIVRSIFN